ncbi:MAG TPA: ABC transporter substrate-binding protein [Azospirillum sp.]|nr:ABC transporter substrate-binding protein [Azospirillum sp.]
MSPSGLAKPLAALSALVLSVLCMPSAAGAQELRIALSEEVSTADPQRDNLRSHNSFSRHAFEPLVERDARLQPVPRLATGWRMLDDRRWEFTLRPGVTFHDGSPFTARDVLYSLCRVRVLPGGAVPFKGFLRGVEEVTAPDPGTVIVRTRDPDPGIPSGLGQIAIVRAPAGANAVFHPEGCTGAAWTPQERFDDGSEAIGTGPFRLVAFRRDGVSRFERNDAYWGARPAWSAVSIRTIADEVARIRSVIAGESDIIDRVAVETLDFLKSWPGVRVVQAESALLWYMQVDQEREPPPHIAGTNGRNPFKDRRVREALSLAISRPALAERVLGGFGAAAGQMVPPGLVGHDPALPPPDHDPDKARRLLAEAGYPDGFEVRFLGLGSRRALIEALEQMLGAIGLRVTVDGAVGKAYSERRANREFGVLISGWATTSGELGQPLRDVLMTHDRAGGTGTVNFGRYSNRALDALASEALGTVDRGAREERLRTAARLVAEDVAIIPLFFDPLLWAMRYDLEITPRMDFFTVATDVRPRP